MPYLFIGDGVPQLEDIFEFFFHTSFCGMFGRVIILSFRFDSMSFSVDVVVHRAISDFRLASSALGFTPS